MISSAWRIVSFLAIGLSSQLPPSVSYALRPVPDQPPPLPVHEPRGSEQQGVEQHHVEQRKAFPLGGSAADDPGKAGDWICLKDAEVEQRLRELEKRLPHGDLIGSRWRITYFETSHFDVEFAADGVLKRVRTHGPAGRETWEWNGGVLQFHLNNKYATYEGRWNDAAKFVGEARNLRGKKWQWSAQRIADDAGESK
ncbi:MAG: hypothetical protein N2C14_05280 [Planctomycetales bacterium]